MCIVHNLPRIATVDFEINATVLGLGPGQHQIHVGPWYHNPWHRKFHLGMCPKSATCVRVRVCIHACNHPIINIDTIRSNFLVNLEIYSVN